MSYKVGVICPSEIAFRRFLPSLQRVKELAFAGVAIASPEEWAGEGKVTGATLSVIERERAKAQTFLDAYGGKIYEGYQTLIESSEIDIVYLPLPPALHFKWAKKVLEAGKHAYVEKPFTTSLADTQTLLSLAREKGLAVHENYMFIFHKQLQTVNDIIASGEIGRVRQYRISFGFPRRAASDFRYNKALGGGALLDAGGYCMKYANYLLGNSAKVVSAQANYLPEFEVEMYGSATMVNNEGITAQLAFGMDNDYRCSIEIWGSEASLHSNRILTAPEGFEPTYQIIKNGEVNIYKMNSDDAFLKSINHFYNCICDENNREENYKTIIKQEILVDDFMKKCKGDS